jgi:hypothetical protein
MLRYRSFSRGEEITHPTSPHFARPVLLPLPTPNTMENHHLDVQISLDEHNDDISHIYTTSSPLLGHVTVTPIRRVRFDEVEITLEGTSTIIVDPRAPTALSPGFQPRHAFLRLTMPIPESQIPPSHMAQPGQIYKFPFNFVIPDRLLPSSCNHKCAGPHVKEAHLRLPPSIGGVKFSPAYLLSQFTRNIDYTIQAKVIQTRGADYKPGVLSSASREVQIIPSTSELPPMYIKPTDNDYAFIRTKELKKGRFKGKLGTITLSAEQPKPFVVSPTSSTPATITAILNARFEPLEPSLKPPSLGNLTSKIKTSTVYAARAYPDLPKRPMMESAFDTDRCVSLLDLRLLIFTIDSSAPWKFRASSETGDGTASEEASRNLALTQTWPAGPSRSGFYEATIDVPITLPQNKTWLPTFHSCLVSRFYSLDFSLTVHSPGNGPSSSLHLRIPVQISSALPPSYAEGTAVGRVEEDSPVRSQTTQVPGEAAFFRGRTLPGYEEELPPGY